MNKDYYDYWQSDVYARYMERIGWRAIGKSGSYGYALHIGPCAIVKYILTDTEPDIASIRAAGSRHGMIYWAPWERVQIAPPWRTLPRSMYVHDWRQGVAQVHDAFQGHWNVRARRNLRAFHESGAQLRQGTVGEYQKGLAISLLPKDLRWLFSRKLDAMRGEQMTFFLVEHGGQIVGGLATLEYDAVSAHISAFLTKAGKQVNAGTACIDAWYRYAVKSGIRYLHFGGVWEKNDPQEWQGFSEFKRNFIDEELSFDRAYWRIF